MKPIQPEKNGTIKALAVSDDALPSSIVEKTVNVYEWQSAERVSGSLRKGLQTQVFELNPSATKDLEGKTPVVKAVADKIGLQMLTRQENTGLRFEGYIRMPQDALYHFYLSSDDGSRLWIDGKEIIDHDGLHGNDEKEGAAALRKGYHKIRVDFIQATGGIDLVLKYSSASVPKQEIPAESYFYR